MSAFRYDVYDASNLTSNVAFVGDAEELTVDVRIGSATTVTLQGSNAQGFRSTIAETDWSTLTTLLSVAANAIYNIEPGFRWFRAISESTASHTGLIVAGRNTTRRA